jgi:hypothetical protein
MNRIFYTVFFATILFTCTGGQSHKSTESKCDNLVLDKKMNVSICFPTNNFEIERKKNYFILNAKKNDTTQLSDVIFMVKVNDFKEKLSSDWYLKKQLKEYQSTPEIELETVNKGTQIIGGKEFADLELIFSMKGNKIYSHTIFYFDGTIGYLLDANVLNDKITEKGKSEILTLYQTFKINGLPKN